ncbi:hypothetical protein KFE25_010666 [Diacronema lutheri]|uniref:Uncharacterized protein n=1 Tax=Diacronema lutheri TaxID=2081491 RepID=A0A8J5XL82_DIALT|nr:hypothetical protein KFE25_010666 [Diacronema lutheri]
MLASGIVDAFDKGGGELQQPADLEALIHGLETKRVVTLAERSAVRAALADVRFPLTLRTLQDALLRTYATAQDALIDEVLADCEPQVEQLALTLHGWEAFGMPEAQASQLGDAVNSLSALVGGTLDQVSAHLDAIDGVAAAREDVQLLIWDMLPPGLPPPSLHTKPDAFQRERAVGIELLCAQRAISPLTVKLPAPAPAAVSVRARSPEFAHEVEIIRLPTGADVSERALADRAVRKHIRAQPARQQGAAQSTVDLRATHYLEASHGHALGWLVARGGQLPEDSAACRLIRHLLVQACFDLVTQCTHPLLASAATPAALLGVEHVFVDIVHLPPDERASGEVVLDEREHGFPCLTLKLYELEFGDALDAGGAGASDSGTESVGEQLAADVALIVDAITARTAALPTSSPEATPTAARTPMVSALLESCVHGPRAAAALRAHRASARRNVALGAERGGATGAEWLREIATPAQPSVAHLRAHPYFAPLGTVEARQAAVEWMELMHALSGRAQ